MGHGLELYCQSGMKELGDFGVSWGLDKIWRVALGMVQMGDFQFCSDQSRSIAVVRVGDSSR